MQYDAIAFVIVALTRMLIINKITSKITDTATILLIYVFNMLGAHVWLTHHDC